MVKLCKDIAESRRFQWLITGVILFAGLLVGIETYPSVVHAHEGLLHVLDQLVLWIFVAEIAIKMVGEFPRPWQFFKDPWNDFDFVIVAAAFMPFAGSAATVLRLVRLLRVLRLVRAVPKLQLLVGALLKSIPSMIYVSILLFLLFYVYAVAGVFMWGENDPHYFGNLELSLLSLFRVVTLEGWTELLYIQMYGCDQVGYDGFASECVAPMASPVGSVVYFVTFVLFGTMIVMNLFIGVILNSMTEAQEEAEDAVAATRPGGPLSLSSELRDLERKLGDLTTQVARIKRAARTDEAVAAAVEEAYREK